MVRLGRYCQSCVTSPAYAGKGGSERPTAAPASLACLKGSDRPLARRPVISPRKIEVDTGRSVDDDRERTYRAPGLR